MTKIQDLILRNAILEKVDKSSGGEYNMKQDDIVFSDVDSVMKSLMRYNEVRSQKVKSAVR